MWQEYIPDIKEVIKKQDPGYVGLELTPQEGAGETLYHLCFAALEALGVKPEPEFIKGLLMAGVLGEVPNDLPYHGNHHYRKVVSQLVRLVAQHQKGADALSDNQIATLLVAACIHDLGHNGQSNTVNGEFVAGRMEQHSFGLAKPYLKAAGLDDDTLNQIQIMLLCTDVLPIGEQSNAANMMKQTYQYHFGEAESPRVTDRLGILLTDKTLTLMALMLHEADLATSAGISYDVAKRETILFRRELTGEDDAKPSHIVEFLTEVCGKQMVLPASKSLYQPQMEEILKSAKADVAAGDKPFSG